MVFVGDSLHLWFAGFLNKSSCPNKLVSGHQPIPIGGFHRGCQKTQLYPGKYTDHGDHLGCWQTLSLCSPKHGHWKA
jgi:hypothetical protein